MPADTRTRRSGSKLERAYVEGKVIRSGLDHLASRLETEDGPLRDDLRACTEHFDAYMRELRDACARADLLFERK